MGFIKHVSISHSDKPNTLYQQISIVNMSYSKTKIINFAMMEKKNKLIEHFKRGAVSTKQNILNSDKTDLESR